MYILDSVNTTLITFPSSAGLEKLQFSGQLPNTGNERLFSALEMYKAKQMLNTSYVLLSQSQDCLENCQW